MDLNEIAKNDRRAITSHFAHVDILLVTPHWLVLASSASASWRPGQLERLGRLEIAKTKSKNIAEKQDTSQK